MCPGSGGFDQYIRIIGGIYSPMMGAFDPSIRSRGEAILGQIPHPSQWGGTWSNTLIGALD